MELKFSSQLVECAYGGKNPCWINMIDIIDMIDRINMINENQLIIMLWFNEGVVEIAFH